MEETYEFVTLENIGKTNEDRDIPAVKISTGGNSSKPIVLLDAGLSPREWIGTAQALYIIRELVENSNNKELITNVDWYVVPLVNPDGYEFTHTQVNFQINQHAFTFFKEKALKWKSPKPSLFLNFQTVVGSTLEEKRVDHAEESRSLLKQKLRYCLG